MALFGASSGWSLGTFLDHFIPKEMLTDAEQHRRARMFMLSHAFGPVLGNSLPVYMYVMGICRDYRVVVFFLSILAFWIYPFLLRWTGKYRLLAFLSVQNLSGCVIWACFAFGGLLSPFLPWMLITPLLAFQYLPPIGWVRNVLLVQIFGAMAVLLWLGLGPVEHPLVDFEELQVIGMISMGSVAIYFGMMSLYFAKMFNEQREFGRELNQLVSSSDNLRNLTSAAHQAGAAKADFIAGMSHELRTPLNAIIGYSQLLLEEADDEGDEESVADLSHVHKAGSDLLFLIDHILDYSRIDAGKMPVNMSMQSVGTSFAAWQTAIAKEGCGYDLELQSEDRATTPVFSDWNLMTAMVTNMVAGLKEEHVDGGCLQMTVLVREDDGFQLVLQDRSADGEARRIALMAEVFDVTRDVSATKYGPMGIRMALAHKFIQLLDGEITEGTGSDGNPVTIVGFPNYAEVESDQKVAA